MKEYSGSHTFKNRKRKKYLFLKILFIHSFVHSLSVCASFPINNNNYSANDFFKFIETVGVTVHKNVSMNITQQTQYKDKDTANIYKEGNSSSHVHSERSEFLKPQIATESAISLPVSFVTASLNVSKNLCWISRQNFRRTLSQLRKEYNSHKMFSKVRENIIKSHTAVRVSSEFETAIKLRYHDDYPDEYYEMSTSNTTSPQAFDLPQGCVLENHDAQTKTVICSGKDMKSVPNFLFLKDLDTLIFNETSIQVLDRKGVEGLPRVSNLVFKRGVLMRVSFSDLMEYQNDIQRLSLVDNSIASLSFSSFYNNPDEDTLEELDLRYNFISNLPQPTVENKTVLHHLKTLILSGNPLELIPGDFFYPLRESNVTTLYINESGITDFGAPTLEDESSPLAFLPLLEILDLSFNPKLSIEKLEGLIAPFVNGNIQILKLDDNSYSEMPTAALEVVQHSIEELSLIRSSFYCLDNTSFPLMPALKVLHLEFSRISEIKDRTFDPLTALEVLYLDGNLLLTLSGAIIIPTLQILTLDGNPSEDIYDDATFKIVENSFNNSKNLQFLSMAKDPIKKVEKYYFKGLKSLVYLGLQDCTISEIEDCSFSDLNNLTHLILKNNELKNITKNTFIGLYGLFQLDLSQNNINFYEITNNANSGAQASSLFMFVYRKLRYLVGSDEVNNNRSTEDTEIARKDGNHDKFIQLPLDVFCDLSNLRVLILKDNNINFLSPRIFEKSKKLKKLNLNYNRIKKWDEPLFRYNYHLNVLMLKNNEIETLTPAMIEDFNKTNLLVDLRGNAFTCSCSLLAFDNELNNTRFVGRSSYKCYNGTNLINIDVYISSVDEPCDELLLGDVQAPPHYVLYILLAGIVVTCLALTVTTYRNRWYLKYLAYKFKINTQSSSQKPGSDEYEYDTFICYAQYDRQWIFEKLIRHLESAKSRLRVCVHERDFLVGEQITSNIIRSVEMSRKVIVVISRAFVKSSWCMFELQMASNKILDERKNKLILLLLESIPTSEQPKELKFLLKSRTYISWAPGIEGERLFWARLMRVIAKPTSNEKELASESSDQPLKMSDSLDHQPISDSSEQPSKMLESSDQPSKISDLSDQPPKMSDSSERPSKMLETSDKTLKMSESSDQVLKMLETSNKTLKMSESSDQVLKMLETSDKTLKISESSKLSFHLSELLDDPLKMYMSPSSRLSLQDEKYSASELDFGEAVDEERPIDNALDIVEITNPYPPLQYFARLQFTDSEKEGHVNQCYESDTGTEDIGKDLNSTNANGSSLNRIFTKIANNLSVSTA